MLFLLSLGFICFCLIFIQDQVIVISCGRQDNMEKELERLYYKGRQSANKKEKVVLETYVAVFVPNIQNRALNWKGRQPAIRETCMRLVQQSVWKSSKLIASEIIAR